MVHIEYYTHSRDYQVDPPDGDGTDHAYVVCAMVVQLHLR